MKTVVLQNVFFCFLIIDVKTKRVVIILKDSSKWEINSSQMQLEIVLLTRST